MLARTSLALAITLLAANAPAAERYVLVGGTVNGFRTDARILNASMTKEVTVSATFLPAGNADNTIQAPVTFTIPPRQMKVVDDVVEALFSRMGVGAIRLSSDDEFEVTTRIYNRTALGTVGQSSPGLPLSRARARGALIQLKSTGSGFRTNIGAVNPNNAFVDVTWTLYGRDNKPVSTRTVTMAPYGVIGPTAMTSGYFFETGSADLSDAWVTYASATETPVFAYAAVIDEDTKDQSFVEAVADEAMSNAKVINITLQNFYMTFSQPFSDLQVGDKVVVRLLNNGGHHGFQVTSPDGTLVIGGLGILPEHQIIERSFVVTVPGTWAYRCNNNCGSGHPTMRGTFTPLAK